MKTYGMSRESHRRSILTPPASSVYPAGASPWMTQSAPRNGSGRMSRLGSPDRSRRPPESARMDLRRAEEIRNLESGRLGRVGAVHGVGLDRRGEVLADRARRGLGGIGGAHEVAEARDGALPFQHHRHAW